MPEVAALGVQLYRGHGPDHGNAAGQLDEAWTWRRAKVGGAVQETIVVPHQAPRKSADEASAPFVLCKRFFFFPLSPRIRNDASEHRYRLARPMVNAKWYSIVLVGLQKQIGSLGCLCRSIQSFMQASRVPPLRIFSFGRSKAMLGGTRIFSILARGYNTDTEFYLFR